MGRVFYSFEAYDDTLALEIAAALMDADGKIQTNAKKEITDTAEAFVYRTYPPRFLSRRYGDGGILDGTSYVGRSSYGTKAWGNLSKGFTLHIISEAQWQQLFGGNPEANPDTLTEAIEKNGLYGADPRPYMEHAETNYGYSGDFERDLVSELEDAGL